MKTAPKLAPTESAQARTEAFLKGETELVPPTIRRVPSDPLIRLKQDGCPVLAPNYLRRAISMPLHYMATSAFCVYQIAKKRGYAK